MKKLIPWLDAKYVSAELVSTTSHSETQKKCMLSQEFDYSLWLASLATQKTLAESGMVAKHFLEAGFSKGPLWAKATGRRAIFVGEFHSAENVKNFSKVRTAITQLMQSLRSCQQAA